MPRIVVALLAVMAVQLTVDAAALAAAANDEPELVLLALVGLLIDAVLIGAIARATEWIRRGLVLGAAIGAGVDAMLLVRLWTHGGYPHEVAVTGGLFAGSVFMAWALARDEVQAWVFERWLARRGITRGAAG